MSYEWEGVMASDPGGYERDAEEALERGAAGEMEALLFGMFAIAAAIGAPMRLRAAARFLTRACAKRVMSRLRETVMKNAAAPRAQSAA